MQAGKIQQLIITKKTDGGFILQDDERGEVFLPHYLGSDQWQENDAVDVFVYQDSGELKATTEKPHAQVGEFAVVECVENLASGAFMDWGIIKDLFVPYKEQRGKMIPGKRYLIYVYLDEETGLITGTAKYKRNPSYGQLPFKPGDKVELIISNESELGWNVVINQKYLGLLYASELFKKIYPFSEEIGYIKNIREDGKIDVTLQPEGFQNIDEYRQKILQKLEENYGLLYLSDDSSPDEIKEQLQMSKKNFKKAIGGLYRDKIIDIVPGMVKLL